MTTKKGSIASQQGPNVNVAAGFNKAAKSVSQSKPPAHAQYFNSAKMKNEGSMMGGGGPANNMQHASNAGSDGGVPPNRTAITTGNGKTQIEIQGNQMLCLWNVNIG